MTYTTKYFKEAIQIIQQLEDVSVEQMVLLLDELRQKEGRLFLIGAGGGAGHASHAVCDFRKIAISARLLASKPIHQGTMYLSLPPVSTTMVGQPRS